MNKHDEVKVTTDTVICEFLEKNKAEASKLPNCTLILGTMTANNQQIFALKSQINAILNSATQQKDNSHQNLVDKILLNLHRFNAYITLKNDKQLAVTISFKVSDVKRAKDSKLVDYGTTLLNKGREMVAQLAEVGVTDASLDELSAALDAFKTTIPLPKLEESTETQINREIKRLIRENDSHRAKIDAIMEIARETNKSFYDSYRSLRRISKPTNNHIALSVNVTDSQTFQPISGVTITVSLQQKSTSGSGKPVQRKSAEKGGIRIKNLIEGTYTLVLSKLGYREQTLTINILSGETTTIAVKFDKA